ncbi:MAG: DUF1015 domain-containing protein [Acidobacteria bacterium]|nr:DUF1015 domain-containing protein [Acidobacteriota bacterium]
MALVRPFRALRPVPEAAAAVAAVPYDVVSSAEARALAAGNPLSFLHVSRAEIDLPADADPYDDRVYDAAASNLEQLVSAAPLVMEEEPSLYVYRLQTAGHEQTGLAACFALDEYDKGAIRKHERTRPDKENDRTRHMLALRAQTGIVFLTYRATPETAVLLGRGSAGEPLLDVEAADGVRHTVWRLDREDRDAAVGAFAAVPALYIADGHHRVASAARARGELARAGRATVDAAAGFVLGVAFPDTATRIQAYNRTVADLAGRTPEQFLTALGARFPLRQRAAPAPPKGEVAVYVGGGTWCSADLSAARPAGTDGGPAARLDVAVLQDHLLAPLLGVADIRTDPRVAFVGGARGTAELERRVDSGAAAVAFSLAPVTTAELFAVSDTGGMMPPKSTWFEPKLRDGLLLHRI